MPTATLRLSPRHLHSHLSISPLRSARRARAISAVSVDSSKGKIKMASGNGNGNANARAGKIRNPVLFICDIQEKFRPVIYEYPKLISTTVKLLKASIPLSIPIYVTTQNRARLGNTVSELTPYLSPSTNPNVRADLDKTLFSMVTPELAATLPSPSSTSTTTPLDVIIVGIESHICVTQTTLDLLELGHRVYVVADGVSSSNSEERGVALARLRDAGATVTTSESLMFEVLGDAGHKGFKEVSGLVKAEGEGTKAALKAFCGSKI
ncbi:hypothetical protein FQN52_001406 [Onygenales sp. PD_12]|nr:hypothetical protein FQN52_001406 [Onygenales sp. PD_12]